MTAFDPLSRLRPGLPEAASFTVSALPHRVKLDQNESPFSLPPSARERILEAVRENEWNRYPQPARYALIKERFASAIGEAPERVVLTAGGDQMILLAYWAAGGPGRSARLFEPTYPMLALYAATTQTPLDRVVLDADFDVAARGLGPRADLLLLVSPNNPTGDGPDRALVLRALAEHGFVFVDEAYADFAGRSVVDLVPEHPNLLVARSLSKSLLAGVRLGYGIGHPAVIAVLERLLFAPYHLSALQLAVAEHFAEIRPHLTERVGELLRERDRVFARLIALGLRVWPSRGNFLLFQVPSAKSTYGKLLEQGVRIRDVSGMPGLGQHLRVTVGRPEENDVFLEALAKSV
jgi:histidinol-phosphate aminotransferase